VHWDSWLVGFGGRYTSGEVFLDEARTEMDVDLDQRLVTDALKAVDLSGLDHQDVARAGLELLAIDDVAASAFRQKLDLVIRMTMRPGTPAGQRPEQERRNVDIALVRSDELVRATLEREILLTNAIHAADILELVSVRLQEGERSFSGLVN
jgi:hypothetical protein